MLQADLLLPAAILGRVCSMVHSPRTRSTARRGGWLVQAAVTTTVGMDVVAACFAVIADAQGSVEGVEAQTACGAAAAAAMKSSGVTTLQ